jgi:hypothetical protein
VEPKQQPFHLLESTFRKGGAKTATFPPFRKGGAKIYILLFGSTFPKG